MKKLLSLILTIVITVSFAMPFSAYATETDCSVMIENPFLTGKKYAPGSIDSEISNPSERRYYNGSYYYGRGKELYTTMKNRLMQREESVRLKFLSSSSLTGAGIIDGVLTLRSFMNEMFFNSTEDELSTGYTDGDYLRYSVVSYGLSNYHYDTYKDGKYYYTLDFTFKFTTTDKEAQKTDAAINSFVNSIDTNSLSDYDIILKVHNYICNKSSYDYIAAANPMSYTYAFSDYGTLVKGKSVCQGYALAFYRICKELGYKVRIATSDPNIGCHAWNMIELDGKMYFVDCTWDDEIFEGGVEDAPRYYYFLISNASTTKYDTHGEHTLDPDYFDTKYFNDEYRKYFDNNDYDRYNSKLLSRSIISLSSRTWVYDGSPKSPAVTVKSGEGNILNKGEDYDTYYYSNINTGYPFVMIRGIGDYENDVAYRHYVIKPSGATKLSFYSSTADSVTLRWTANSGGVSGYSIEQYKNGNWTAVRTSSGTTATVTGLSAATAYGFRIRAYKDISKRRFYGDCSASVRAYTHPAKVKNLKLKTTKKKLKISYGKANATGYIIQYSRKKNMKGAKEIKLTGADKTNKTVKKLKSKKKYYVRVKAYKNFTFDGKTVTMYGKWSAKKAIKIK